MWLRLIHSMQILVLTAAAALVLTYSGPTPTGEYDRARAYTRNIEFEYLSWMIDAARVKALAAAAGIPGYLDRSAGRIVVSDYLQATRKIIRAEDALTRIYADPTVTDKDSAASLIRADLQVQYVRQQELAPLAEAVFQGQVEAVAADFGLATLGQPIPPILYHTTSVPDALIVSPRAQIRQSANISIQAGLPIDQQAALERKVEQGLNASALVVPIGGVGIYPTMIMQTADRGWLVSTIAHEWTHNYLQLRPLGLLYDHTPELRTMNETTADIVGTEIGLEVIRRFYSGITAIELPDANLADVQTGGSMPPEPAPIPFDFREEMHTTRVNVDRMLASGKIVEAEDYMERRRQLFVKNGFFIRRLNQAYFAFYGAYADVPGGAAGQDPVGPAVRALRARSSSLAEFVNQMAWMTSFEQLQQLAGQ